MMYVTVHFGVELQHCWPDAPDAQAWLQYLHLHEFRVAVSLQVFEADREVEFYALRDNVRAAFAKDASSLLAKDRSCEALAIGLKHYVNGRYPGRWVSVTVAEDENFSATVEDTR